MNAARITRLACLALVFPLAAHAQETLIAFDDMSTGRVTTQYAARGVRFVPGAFIDVDQAARSGGQVLRAANPTSEFHTGPLVLEFSSGQKVVRMFAAGFNFDTRGTATAFDASGRRVARDGPRRVRANRYTTEFRLSAGLAVIRRVVLHYDGAAFESIDDLAFAGEPAASVATVAPEVSLAIVDTDFNRDNGVTLSGTVTGQALVSPITLEMRAPVPPGSMAPVEHRSFVPLSGAGTSRTFAVPIRLHLGAQTIVVRAENASGLTGSDSVDVTHFPSPLDDIIRREGPARLGAFQFAGGDSGCVYAVFERAAHAFTRGVGVASARGRILEKWLSAMNGGVPTFGCPTSPERGVEGERVAKQDFQRARIYAGRRDAYHVPAVFAAAIDAHGGESAVGIPIDDPNASPGTSQTWVFQRFRRPSGQDPVSTLEIRGTPPRLYVQRRADHPRASVPGPHSPTIVDEHPCAGNLGPCDVRMRRPDPLNDIGRFCDHEFFDWRGAAAALLDQIKVDAIDAHPPEWVAITGHHVLTPVRGVVVEAKFATGDLPLTHEFPLDCPPKLGPLVASWRKDGEPTFCSTDWDIYLRPLPGYRGVLGIGRGSNPEYHEKAVIEYERVHARAFTAFGGDPHEGDLVHAVGRWIVDCGHAYKTEIHPPSVLAYMREVAHDGRPATLAHVWVNGFFTGDQVELLVHPPPRPSPDATLVVQKVLGPSTGVRVVEGIVGPGTGQYYRLRFSAPIRRVRVTDLGEMRMEGGREFKGRYLLFWTNAP